MPFRTSAVVILGIGLLTVIGVTTIFGNSIVAMVASPHITGTIGQEGTRDTIGGNVVPDPRKPSSANASPKTVPPPSSGAAGDAGQMASPHSNP